MLFQAKKIDSGRNAILLDQTKKMEALMPGCSSVFEYGPNGYRAIDGKVIVSSGGRMPEANSADASQLGDYLADKFLPCEVGIRGFFYQGRPRLLVVPDETTGVARYRAELKGRIRIEVQKT